MAAALLKRALEAELGQSEAQKVEVSSAGLAAIPGSMASPQAMAVLREEGLDLTAHRAQQVTREMLKAADLILTMTRRQKEFLLEWDPATRGKVWTLGEVSALAGKDTAETQDICDPFRQGEEVYRSVREDIKASLDPLVTYIKKILTK
ncbi:MAG: low molecular weight protein arginine phosphatase [Firmicutes bacterium]|jgi:protein-tyrosine-phosphatase|nr:low molecular weight protein arginine phosphatase [Bacillota bacterium]